MSYFPSTQTNRRGLSVDNHLRLLVPSTSPDPTGSSSIFALGDCTASSYAPTAQVASQQGAYLARLFGQMAKREKALSRLSELAKADVADPVKDEERKKEIDVIEKQLARAEQQRPFHYSHQGSLAYIGSEKAIADLPFGSGNVC